MRLKERSGNEFQLVILSYQHPDVHEDRWDSNWLMVSGAVATAAGQKWKFSAPCVTTFEMADLADWLDDVSADGRAPTEFTFTEPHVRFAYVPWPKPTLQVRLADEGAPPGLSDHERHAGVTVEFGLPPSDAAALAAEIRAALADFPIRGGAA